MLLWVIFIIIAIVVLFLLFCNNYTDSSSTSNTNNTSSDRIDPNSDDAINYPTMHARCRSNSSCGGDLICDLNCRRCRKKLGGDCSSDIDCESGLHCYDWKCIPNPNFHPVINTSNLPPDNSDLNQNLDTKEVHWDDNQNITYYI